MGSLLAAFGVCVVGQVVYHLVLRGAGPTVPPFTLVVATYLVALVAVAAGGVVAGEFSGPLLSGADAVRAVGLGLGVACVELGYVYAYRYGLPVSTGALTVLAATTLALFPLGVAVYGERVNWRAVMGVLLAIAGVWLLASSKGR